jgi:hypothetical protein
VCLRRKDQQKGMQKSPAGKNGCKFYKFFNAFKKKRISFG